jgi:hypothetical protein
MTLLAPDNGDSLDKLAIEDTIRVMESQGGSNLDHLTSRSRGRSRGSGSGTVPSA